MFRKGGVKSSSPDTDSLVLVNVVLSERNNYPKARTMLPSTVKVCDTNESQSPSSDFCSDESDDCLRRMTWKLLVP